jgi:hypothetical protein
MKPNQEFLFNGAKATIRETADGELEISGDEFIHAVIELGFKPGHQSPNSIEEILKHIPAKYRQDFWDSFYGK